MFSRGKCRTRASGVAAASLLVLLAGCSSDADEPGTGGDSPESPTTSTSVAVPTPTPTVEPADGPLIKTEGATIRGLPSYRRVSDFGALQGYRDDQSTVTLLPGYTDVKSLDAFAKQEVRTSNHPDALERVDDVVVGGKYNAFHFLDTSDPHDETHVFGLMFLDGSWIIKMSFYERGEPRPLTAEERQQVMDSILASFEVVLN
jgi:hypothetical protein